MQEEVAGSEGGLIQLNWRGLLGLGGGMCSPEYYFVVQSMVSWCCPDFLALAWPFGAGFTTTLLYPVSNLWLCNSCSPLLHLRPHLVGSFKHLYSCCALLQWWQTLKKKKKRSPVQTTEPWNGWEPLFFPVSSQSRCFHPTSPLCLFPHRHTHTQSMRFSSRSMTLKRMWWQSLVADEIHFLLFSQTQGEADSCVCYPCIKSRAPVNVCHMIHRFLTQRLCTRLYRVLWKYRFPLKIE